MVDYSCSWVGRRKECSQVIYKKHISVRTPTSGTVTQEKTFSLSVRITKRQEKHTGYDLCDCHMVDPEKKQVYLGWAVISRWGWVGYTLLSIVGLWVSSMTDPLVVGSLSVPNQSQAFPVCLQSPLKALKPLRALHWWPAHGFQRQPSTPQLQKETLTSCGPVSICWVSQHDLIRIHRYLWCGVVWCDCNTHKSHKYKMPYRHRRVNNLMYWLLLESNHLIYEQL